MEIPKKAYIKNIAWLFFERGVYIFGGLFVGIWVARYLGPTEYGVLNYAIAFTALFSFFSKLGLDRIVVRELTKKPDKKNLIIGTAFFMKLTGGIIAVVLISIFLLTTKFDEKTLLVTTLLVSLGYIFQSLDVIDYYYQAKVLSKYVVIARNSAYILTIIFQIFLITHDYPVQYFALAALCNFTLASFFLLLIYARTDGQILKWKFNYKFAKKLMLYSWPLMISGFLITIHMRIDQLMVNYFLDLTELGIYSVSVRLVELWYVVPNILVTTLMPYFVNIREKNNKLYYQRLKQFFSITFWMGAIVGIGSILFGQQLIDVLYGDAYQDAYGALIFNIWSVIFVSQALASGVYLIAENFQKYRLYISIIAVTLNIGLNLIFIPKFGISGAAIATFLTQALTTWFFPLFFKPLKDMTIAMIKSSNPKYLFNKK